MLGVQLPVGPLIKASRGINRHRTESAEAYLGSRAATDGLMKLELLPVTNYLPDAQRIRHNGVRVFLAMGEWALDKQA